MTEGRLSAGATRILLKPRLERRAVKLIGVLAVLLLVSSVAKLAVAAPPSASSSVSVSPPSASILELARAWARKAAEAYAREDWTTAREHYMRAWQLRPHYSLAANLADVELRLGQFRDAAEHLRFFLQKLPAEQEDKRSLGEEDLARCLQQLTVLDLDLRHASTEVIVDGERLSDSETPQPLYLTPGTHHLTARAIGFRDRDYVLVGARGETRRLVVELERAIKPIDELSPAKQKRTDRPPVPLPNEAPHSQRASWIPIYAAAGVAAASAVVGAAFWIQATTLRNRAQDFGAQFELDDCRGASPSSNCLRLHAVVTRQKDAARCARVAFGTAGASLILAGAYWLIGQTELARALPKRSVQFEVDEARPGVSVSVTDRALAFSISRHF